ncbi:MAG: hypothetical protein IJ346_06795, partial [Clostridia bacterium]|nr:hypothetical protein [Clostridia bacterium]
NTMGTVGTATEGRFYINYDLTNEFVSNKNRFPYTMFMTNDVGTRGRFFNVYAYVVVTDKNDGTLDTYYSNMQTLNIYETGNYDSSDYK